MRNKRILFFVLVLIVLAMVAIQLPKVFKGPGRVSSVMKAPGVHSTLEVHFLDVGQADSILIKNEDAAMLIDAGNNGDGDGVVEYLRDEGIEDLDYVIGTHPHEDHVGGLDDVVDSFDVENVIMPAVSNTTRTFEDVVDSIESKALTVTAPVAGQTYKLNDAEFTILSPVGQKYDNFNEYSVVIRLDFGGKSFLFCGDAEELNEEEMLSKALDLDVDVIKLGHHGSNTSTSEAFLQRVTPTDAVISVGEGNTYGHPAGETLGLLNSMGVNIYRTDEDGTVVYESDGRELRVSCVATAIGD